MHLYIVRHGEAERETASDAQRALTARGGDEVKRLWTELCGSQPVPARIVSSSLLRARQTARIVADVYGAGLVPEESALLIPEAVPEQTLAWLAAQPDLDGWVLVSHMPLVALLTGLLVEGPGERYPFAVGSVACLDLEVACPGGARLLWLRAPEPPQAPRTGV